MESDTNSIFIVGDAHQRIYNRKASLATSGVDVRGRSRRLRLNYRTSDEIRKWAVSILESVSVDDLDGGMDSLNGYISVFHGPWPELAGADNEEAEIAALIDWLRETVKNGANTEDIGVLVAKRDQADKVALRLEASGLATVRLRPSVADNRSEPGIRISTMHRAKGLEFQAVAIPFLSDSAFPPAGALRAAVDDVDRRTFLQQEKALLHVAATRAKRLLRVSWSGEPSKLLMIR